MTDGPAWVLRLEPGPAGAAGAAASAGDGPRVAVKDAIDVAGTVTSVGSRSREDSGVATADAPCVAAVRRGGGLVVGKTALSELCWRADGINDRLGTPVNPLDRARVPGGSSSGSAVVVALGEADVALGTDTGGSVRIPAACCGVAGLKTTWGRVPTAGVFPLAPALDTVGPLARDVAGLVTAMRLLEPGFTVAVPGARPVVARLRLGPEVRVDEAVDRDVDEAVAGAGWEVREVEVRGWRPAFRAAGVLLDHEAGIAQGFLLDRPELLGDGARAAIEACLRVTPAAVEQAREVVDALGRHLSAALADVDALVLPTITGAPPLRTETDSMSLTILTLMFNVLGWPAVAVPARPSQGAGDVPPSVQVVAGAGAEEQLLGLAAALPTQRGAPG